jgi:hypothetical protein
MVIYIYTNDGNHYPISNDPSDDGCPYEAEDNALYIFLTNPESIYFDYKTEDISYVHSLGDKEYLLYFANPRNLFFNYKNASIVVPYDMIDNVIYGDEIGEELAAFIISKKRKEDVTPPTPPSPPPEPPKITSITRDKRVLTHRVYGEMPLFDPDYYPIVG